MGFLWDLIQQSQLSERRSHAESLEMRIQSLEDELRETQRLLHEALKRVEAREARLDEDLNRDGRIG